jgi:hypothetical protein
VELVVMQEKECKDAVASLRQHHLAFAPNMKAFGDLRELEFL